ncbi:MAG TPA: glycosyltransferase family 39 protein [Devosia sp.]|nr:glycosyltransferase family 39 protein [Devosia sp.]
MTDAHTSRDLPIWLRPWAVLLFVLAMLAVRLFVAGNVGLVRDEAYYALWSFWPGFGYYDHPPMVAWVVALGRALVGENELGVRLVPVLASGITSLAVYRTGQILFDLRTAGIAVIWFNVTVAAGLLFIAAPDAPAVMFWALSIWAVAEFVARRNANWWLLAGAFAGLGLLSKYTVGFLGIGFVLYLLTSRERRGWLRHWQVWGGGALALLVFAPNFIWNAQHDWVSIAFQGQRFDTYGLNFGSFTANFLDFIGGQALATGVFLFIFVVIGTVLYVRRSDLSNRANLALPLFTAAPILIYFTYYCIRFRVEANWPVVAWPMLSLVGAWAAVHLRPRNGFFAGLLAVFRWAQVPIGLILTVLIYVQAVWQPWSIVQTIDRTRDMRGWSGLYADAAALGKANGATWIASAGNYGLAAELATYAKFAGDDWPVWQITEDYRYVFRPPLDPALKTQPALVVTPGDQASVELLFDSVRPLGTASRTQRAGEVLETVNLFVATGLKNR